jgi:hypothetical protein
MLTCYPDIMSLAYIRYMDKVLNHGEDRAWKDCGAEYMETVSQESMAQTNSYAGWGQ